MDIFCDAQDDWYGSQCLGHASHSRGFLTYQAVSFSKVLVFSSCLHSADSELGYDVLGVLDGFSPVRFYCNCLRIRVFLLSVVRCTLKGEPRAFTMRCANPPTISRRSALLSINQRSVTGSELIRVRKPSIISGVYVDPPPITVTFSSSVSSGMYCISWVRLIHSLTVSELRQLLLY